MWGVAISVIFGTIQRLSLYVYEEKVNNLLFTTRYTLECPVLICKVFDCLTLLLIFNEQVSEGELCCRSAECILSVLVSVTVLHDVY